MNDQLNKEPSMRDKIAQLQKDLLLTDGLHDNPPPLKHSFAPGIYIREVFMSATDHTYVIGCRHKTKHFNIILSGKARVMQDEDGTWETIEGPTYFVSEPGVKKILVIYEDMRWITVHPVEGHYTEDDIEELEDMIFEEPPTKIREEAATQRLLRQKEEMKELNRNGGNT